MERERVAAAQAQGRQGILRDRSSYGQAQAKAQQQLTPQQVAYYRAIQQQQLAQQQQAMRIKQARQQQVLQQQQQLAYQKQQQLAVQKQQAARKMQALQQQQYQDQQYTGGDDDEVEVDPCCMLKYASDGETVDNCGNCLVLGGFVMAVCVAALGGGVLLGVMFQESRFTDGKMRKVYDPATKRYVEKFVGEDEIDNQLYNKQQQWISWAYYLTAAGLIPFFLMCMLGCVLNCFAADGRLESDRVQYVDDNDADRDYYDEEEYYDDDYFDEEDAREDERRALITKQEQQQANVRSMQQQQQLRARQAQAQAMQQQRVAQAQQQQRVAQAQQQQALTQRQQQQQALRVRQAQIVQQQRLQKQQAQAQRQVYVDPNTNSNNVFVVGGGPQAQQAAYQRMQAMNGAQYVYQ